MKRRQGDGVGGLFLFLFPWGSQSLLHAETRGVFLIMPHTQLDQSEDSILIHAPIWIIRKYDRGPQWRGRTFFFLAAKRKGICSSCAVFRLPGEAVGGGGGGQYESEGLQGGLFPAGLGDLSQIGAK